MALRETTPSSDLINYTYDQNGNNASVSNPYRTTSDPTYGTTGYTYDVLGRLTKTTAADGSVYTTVYSGNTALYTDPAGHQRETVMDGMGRISQVLEPNSSGSLALQTTYAYLQNYSSSAGTTQTIVQQQGGSTTSSQWRTRTFTTDMAGRMVQAAVPESGTTTYTYSGFGNAYCAGNLSLPCTRTDSRGVATTYTYDGLYRPTGMSYAGITPSTPAVSYLYDQTSYNGLTIANGLGQRTGMTDGSGATAWSYDKMGRAAGLEKTIDGVTKLAGYTYNLDGTVNTLTDFYGDALTYAYNAAGFPSSVSDSAGYKFASSASYSPAGGITSLLQGNSSNFAGVTTSNSFNNRLQQATISASNASTPVISLNYAYGASQQNNGNILGITNHLNSARSQVFGYDQLNRLTSAQASTLWGDTYAYDNWGNLLQKNPIAGVTNAENISVAANASNQITTMQYDAAGDVTTDNVGNIWTYDAEGRPNTVSGTSYTYDGDGHRVAASSGSTGTIFWANPSGQPISESDLSGNQLHRDVYFSGQLVARQDSSGTTHYFVRDQIGSERISVNQAGALEDDLDYYPWGNGIPNEVSYGSGEPYTFGSYYSDNQASQTYHTDYRQQSPVMGRWLRPDPYYGSYDLTNPQSLNRYAYVMNSPLGWVDPRGLDYIDENGNLCTQSADDTSASVTCYGYLPISGSGGGGGNQTGGGGGAPSKPPQMPPHTPVCYERGCVDFDAPPPTKEHVCHTAAVVALAGLLAIPGVDIPVGAAWAIYGTGAATGVLGVTLCW